MAKLNEPPMSTFAFRSGWVIGSLMNGSEVRKKLLEDGVEAEEIDRLLEAFEPIVSSFYRKEKV